MYYPVYCIYIGFVICVEFLILRKSYYRSADSFKY